MKKANLFMEVVATYRKYGWELRLLEQTQYALFEAFEPDETEPEREEVRLEMEARLREHVLGQGT
jgi:hypothetical protein